MKGIILDLKPSYRDLDDEGVRALARDIALGLVFTDMHIPEGVTGDRIFIPLLFLSEQQIRVCEEEPPGMIFEHLARKGPRMATVEVEEEDGTVKTHHLPMFQSVNFLTVECANRVKKEIEKCYAMMAAGGMPS